MFKEGSSIKYKLVRKMVPLVHSMWSDSATKCLIVKDLDKKHEDTVDMTEELLKEHQVTGITKVLPLDQLKKEHKGKSSNKLHLENLHI